MTRQEVDLLCEGDLLSFVMPNGDMTYYVVSMLHHRGAQLMQVGEVASNRARGLRSPYISFEDMADRWDVSLVSRATQGRPR